MTTIAAVRERAWPDRRTLELIEEVGGVREDVCEALAFALDAGDLWSLHETIQANEAVAALPEVDEEECETNWNATVAAECERLATDRHRERLAVLVRRLRGWLPLEGYPSASVTLAQGCDEFERDPAFRARLAALLLAESLSWPRVDLSAA